MRPLLLAFAMLIPIGFAQQPNSPEASLIINSLPETVLPQRIVLSTQALSPTISLEIAGGATQPYLLGFTTGAPLEPGLSTPAGILDLDFGSLRILMDGIGRSVGPFDALARTDSQGSSTWVLPTSGAGPATLGSFQAAVSDPASALGFRFSSAAEIRLEPTFTRLYVSHSRGTPSGLGNLQQPLQTITSAYERVRSTGTVREIHVEQGTYTEQPVPQIGIDLAGGFSADFATRPGRSQLRLTTGPMHIRYSQLHVTTWEKMDIHAAAPNSTNRISSIALIATATSLDFVLRDCHIEAADAGNGQDGADGMNGVTGLDGGDGSLSTGGYAGWLAGVGGDGGLTSNGIANGLVGGSPINGNAPGGSAGTPTAAGGHGGDGTAGSAGRNAFSSPANGGFNVNGYTPRDGQDGERGNKGRGGAGGGGGGALGFVPYVALGGGGGGGGEGGGHGDPGRGGHGGGASVGILLIDGTLTIDGCTIISGNGGDGGAGGDGGRGGSGGAGGSGAAGVTSALGTLATAGGNGGRGGPGGCGGSGAGGTPGPSWSIFRLGTRQPLVQLNSNQLSFGLPGARGPGGFCPTHPTPIAAQGQPASSGAIGF